MRGKISFTLSDHPEWIPSVPHATRGKFPLSKVPRESQSAIAVVGAFGLPVTLALPSPMAYSSVAPPDTMSVGKFDQRHAG